MDDSKIIELYMNRDETAISETERQYGAYCRTIASNILSIQEDAEECVNDAYLTAWNRIPPEHPDSLRAWLGRVTRNSALNKWNREHARKRYNGITMLLDELAECVPSSDTREAAEESRSISLCISTWLLTLPEEDRKLFVRRYWYGEPLNDLAASYKTSSQAIAQKMYRLRRALKAALEKEDIRI